MVKYHSNPYIDFQSPLAVKNIFLKIAFPEIDSYGLYVNSVNFVAF